MKTLLKALQALPTLSTLATLLCFAPLAAQPQFDYVTNDGTITITGYTGSGGDVSIPKTIGGLPVTQWSLPERLARCSRWRMKGEKPVQVRLASFGQ